VGLDRAETRYVAFLDADDLWEPDKLVRQLRALERSGAGLCIQGRPTPLDDLVYRLFVGDVPDVTSSILVDTSRVSVRFEEALENGEDLLFVMETASEAGACFVPDLFTRRQHESSLTATGFTVEEYRTYGKLFGRLVSERVPAAQPYLPIYYNQLYTELGLLEHRRRNDARATAYFRRALQITFHPYTLAYLLRSLVYRRLPLR